MSTEEKPEVKAEARKHSVTVVMKGGEELTVVIKSHTKMKKLYDAVAANRGLEKGSFKLTHDGEVVDENASPETLNFEEEEQLDVQMAQIGGGASL